MTVTDNGKMHTIKTARNYFQKKQFNAAIRLCINSLKTDSNNIDLLNILGLCFQAKNKPLWAIKCLEKAKNLNPHNGHLINNLALLYQQQKQVSLAIDNFAQAREINPKLPGIGFRLANLYYITQKYHQALEIIDSELIDHENSQTLLMFKGLVLLAMNHHQEAYQQFKALLPAQQDNAQLHFSLGIVAYQLGKFAEAIEAHKTAAEFSPDNPKYWIELGLAQKKQTPRNIIQEIKSFRSGLVYSPDHLYLLLNLANALIDADRLYAAKRLLEYTLAKHPSSSEASVICGHVYQLLHLSTDAERCNLEALKSENPEVLQQGYVNQATLLLSLGRFKEGWEAYEQRWQHRQFKTVSNRFSGTLWQGESINNKTLMVYTEQGYGDTINFARYLPLIDKGTGKLIIECRPALVDLIKTVDNINQVISRDETLPSHEYYIPLLSLPRIFQTKIDTIPTNIPYLSVHKQKQQYWESYFQQYKEQFNIGIAWAGSTMHKHDRFRSVKPELFKKLKINERINLFSLQLDAEKSLCDTLGFISLADDIQDFTDSAAIINSLDLVISVDTAIVHLAGALNKPVWNIVGFYFDWRWMFERTDSPWYPSMTLFRQAKRGDWQQVFEEIALKLKDIT